MYKLTVLIATFLLCGTVVNAQTLYMPRDVQKAYTKGTRSPNGKPGKNYWQNHARYSIAIKVQPANHTVQGMEQITYINNSPDTLKQLNMKLILNIHRPGAVRFGTADPDYLTDGMRVDSIFVNGTQGQWNNDPVKSGATRQRGAALSEPGNTTNKFVSLVTPLLPHDSVKLHIAWHYQLSLLSGREGVIDSTTFYIAYFYPRVSVYDDYNGWDRLDFNDRQEFYNDFNDYSLKVTVPKNYVVWATGSLQNVAQVLQPKFTERLKASMLTDSVIHVATAQDMAAKTVTAQNDWNTWVWTAANISDMAVGVSNHYVWDAASVLVDDATQRRASMQAAFADESTDFHSMVKAGVHSLGYFSHSWPGVPYPFPKMTAFQGFADMEFPMMVNDGHNATVARSASLQDHEMAHTYFPFYMGINETRYGYMDEGWATTFQLLVNMTEIGEQQALSNYKNARISGWINDPAESEDLPLITPTSELKGGYAHNAYGKASLSYLALKDLLGDALFKKALHTYMSNWNGKHPIPWDYFNSMNSGAGQNLNWFFQNWFFTNGYIDLAITKVNKVPTGYQMQVDNIGGYAVPFDVVITYADGTTGTIHQTPAIWKANQKQVSISLKSSKGIKSIKIDGGIFMDANEKDNIWTAQ